MPFFNRAIQIDPNFASAYVALGRMYGDIGESGLSEVNTSKAYQLAYPNKGTLVRCAATGSAGTKIREYCPFHVRSVRGWNEPGEESQKELAWLRQFHTQLRRSESAH